MSIIVSNATISYGRYDDLGRPSAIPGETVNIEFEITNYFVKSTTVRYGVYDVRTGIPIRSPVTKAIPVFTAGSEPVKITHKMPTGDLALEIRVQVLYFGVAMPGGTTVTLPVIYPYVPPPTTGFIDVRSTPEPGAFVLVDGERVFKETPIVIETPLGVRMVSVEKPGYVTPPAQPVLPGSSALPTLVLFTLLPELPRPVICLPSIDKLDVPGELPIAFPAIGDIGLPTIDIRSVPVGFDVKSVCTRDGMSASDPKDLFPMDVELDVLGTKIPIKVDGYGRKTLNIASQLHHLATTGRIPSYMRSVRIALTYPSEITFTPLPDGRVDRKVTRTAVVNALIPIKKAFEPVIPTLKELLCRIYGMLSQMGSIPIGAASIPVHLNLSAMCNDDDGKSVTAPADLFTGLDVDILISGSRITTLRPDRSGLLSLNLADFSSAWMPMLAAIPDIPPTKTLELTARFPSLVKVASVTPLEYGEVRQTLFFTKAEIPYIPEIPVITGPARVMDMAIPGIMYEGQAVDIVVQSSHDLIPSSGEPATLVIDDTTIRTKNTSAGTVTFRWTATGVGMHRVCVNIPENPVCAAPGSTCKTIMVSAEVPGLAEQIQREKAAYEEELERLRELREIEREEPIVAVTPGSISIPSLLAGATVEIGGVTYTVPEGGITVPADPGETIVTVIEEGVKKIVPVIVSPGEIVILPLPSLPGGS